MFTKFVSHTLPLIPKGLVWHFSKPYIAGETVTDAIRVSRALNHLGARVTVDQRVKPIHLQASGTLVN